MSWRQEQRIPVENLEFALVMVLAELDRHAHDVSPVLKEMWRAEWEQRLHAKQLLEQSEMPSFTLQL